MSAGVLSDFDRLFNLLQEPTFVLGPDGSIVRANPAGEKLLGGAAPDALLASVADPLHLRRLIATASGMGSPIPGAIVVGPDGERARLKVRAARFGGDGPRPAVLLQVFPGESEFAVLTRKVRELNDEIRQRRAAEVALAAALRSSRSMLNELHHSVRNTTQMLLAMLADARRAAGGATAEDVLTVLRRRVLGLAAAQQLLYRSDRMNSVAARALLQNVLSGLREELGSVRVRLDVSDVELSNEVAVPVALLAAELAAAAGRAISVAGEGTLVIGLRSRAGGYELSVGCHGLPGRDLVDHGLDVRAVKGLVLQMGGVLAASEGPEYVISFHDMHSKGALP
ncbi:histidine kinase dimerization/phosphoacceptor domain -containing protein [Propylenella binzhouense]|uniref:histidine kinase n=1 Tax=Propylenella binzhouense TaxID=2555902 RepID=A0A964WUL0_9HYPH|nr:histidine kinase dimerization/phosphoacceptor domain -containing protein [Propylenella binzhouense]MYZ49237.1 hypothetical protein [Propylenella binzhouense]